MNMKVSVLFFMTVISLSFAGCHPESEEIPALTVSGIVVRAASGESAERSAAAEPVVFSGEDILWFNKTTGELRFKDNVSNKSALANLNVQAIKFYVDDEYLFSSMLCVSDFSLRTFHSLVFYYNAIENKYFLKDGYPDTAEIANLEDTQEPYEDIIRRMQELRDENMRKIAPGWSRFMEQLKKEERYKN
jgi:hypothetical protein